MMHSKSFVFSSRKNQTHKGGANAIFKSDTHNHKHSDVR